MADGMVQNKCRLIFVLSLSHQLSTLFSNQMTPNPASGKVSPADAMPPVKNKDI
jgi:hypothetical protein